MEGEYARKRNQYKTAQKQGCLGDLQSSNMAEREMKEGSGQRQAEVREALT